MKKIFISISIFFLLFVAATATAQPGGGIEFTPPPFHTFGTDEEEGNRGLYSERPKSEQTNFAIRQEGMVTFIHFITERGDTLDVPMLFSYWTAERTFDRTIIVFADDIMRGYPRLVFSLHIDCDPEITKIPVTRVTNKKE